MRFRSNLHTLETVHTFETGLDSVKTIYGNENYICIGGNGNIGSVQVWDTNAMTMLHSREANNDIQAVMHRKNILYYGGQNCCVNRFRTDTLVIYQSIIIEKYGATSANPLQSSKRIKKSI